MLLTGAAGFLGRHIVRAQADEDVTTLDLAGCDINVDLAAGIPSLSERFDLVVHAAGKAHSVPRTPEQAEEFFRVNVQGTRHLLQGLEQGPVLPRAVVFISTVAVYGVEAGVGITEEAPLNGNTPYADSKIKAERCLLDWGAKKNVNIVILRLPLVAGTNPPGNLGAMLQAIRRGYYFRPGKGSVRRSMVGACDLAELLPDLLDKAGIYNLTDGIHPSIAEIDTCLSRQMNKRVIALPEKLLKIVAKLGDRVSWVPLNSVRIQKLSETLTFSDAKARKELGWDPRPALESLKAE
jgi:GlcNAc-P-P-Und epimerase